MKILKFLTLGILVASLTACGVAGPKGEKGDKGDQGVPGQTGPQGPAGQDGADGQDGKDGVDGQDGKDGVDGLPGTDGATWLTGEQDPTNEDGKDGDLYLNTVTFDLFFKSNGIWSKIGNIKGKDGVDGVDGQDGKDGTDGVDGQDGKDGADGLPGTDGATWLTGLEDPSNGDGKDGDLYLNTTSSDIFIKVNGEWVKIGNIKGNPGENGHDADTYGRVHTVTFDAGEGELINYEETIQVNYGETIELPLAERDTYIFTGWYTGFGVNDGKFTSVTPVTKDITLYAGWEAEQLYTIYFHSNGGSTIETVQYQNNQSVTNLPSPTKVDYAFYGWYYDDGLSNKVSYPFIINKDLDLYAKWVDAYYTLSFNTTGGNDIDSDVYLAGSEIAELPTPSKQYQTFAGWYLDSGYVTPVTLPFEIHVNLTIYAKWNTTNSTITFNSNGGSDVVDKVVVTGSYLTSANMPTPTRENYTFAGWYTNAGLTSAVSYPYLVTGNITLYAKWSDNYLGYTKISTYYQLKSISNMSRNYVLLNDINCSGQQINEIGTATSPFTGIFDGAGHTISNFSINYNENDVIHYGLFGFNSGSIINLKTNGTITCTATKRAGTDVNATALGGLVGYNNGLVNACQVDSTINFTYYSSGTDSGTSYLAGIGCAGGVVGYNAGQVTNCRFGGTMQATTAQYSTYATDKSQTGGIVGTNTGTVSTCAYVGSLTVVNNTANSSYRKSQVNGICSGGQIINCISIGNIGTTNVSYGGYVAYAGTMANCYRYANMTCGASTLKDDVNSASLSQINSSSFYVGSVKFDSTIWNSTSLNYNSGIYVSLR